MLGDIARAFVEWRKSQREEHRLKCEELAKFFEEIAVDLDRVARELEHSDDPISPLTSLRKHAGELPNVVRNNLTVTDADDLLARLRRAVGEACADPSTLDLDDLKRAAGEFRWVAAGCRVNK